MTGARLAASVAAALALLASGCGSGAPEQLSDGEARTLSSASIAIIGACERGPLNAVQEQALRPRLEQLVQATARHPEALFEYPQDDQNPLLTTPSLELQAVVGALGGVGPQRACSRRLALVGDRGLTAAGYDSMLRDMPSARR